MLLTDSASIRDVLLFPTMKPIGTPAPSAKAAEEKASETAAPAAETAAERPVSRRCRYSVTFTFAAAAQTRSRRASRLLP